VRKGGTDPEGGHLESAPTAESGGCRINAAQKYRAASARGSCMSAKARNVLLVLTGVAGLVLKGRYQGPWQALVSSYWGNVTASFAVYFILANLPFGAKLGRLWTAGCAFATVGLFEATDGFRLMTNTYDPFDYAANAAGIGLALLADRATARFIRRP
jgi:hypothetical protein